MTILNNAIDSIVIGLEDFSAKDPRRALSCTRNILAGILLLFKAKLSLLSAPESDEALLKQRVRPIMDAHGHVTWKGKGGKTVDVQEIQDRFETLGIQVDWKRLDKINKIRNDIEHYYTSLEPKTIRALISDSFIIINDFIRRYLDKDPKLLLGDSVWSLLLEVNEVYEREKEECEAALEKLDYFSDQILAALSVYTCEQCGSDLLSPVGNELEAASLSFICRACNQLMPYEDLVKEALRNHYAHEVYLSHTDGGDMPITDCPECDGIYLYEEGICSGCGFEAKQTCARCSSRIVPEEMGSSPYCGYCAYIIAKDD